MGKFGAQVTTGMPQIKGLELTETKDVKEDGQGHEFREAQGTRTPALFLAIGQELLFKGRLEFTTEVVNQAEDFG